MILDDNNNGEVLSAAGLAAPLKSASIVKQIIAKVEHDLLYRRLHPGDRFPSETELVRTLGVSKSSVREAVKMLQAIGVLTVKQGDGTYVNESPGGGSINPLLFSLLLIQGDAQQIVELRSLLEPAYTILAMKKATPEDMRRIEETIEELETSIANGTQTGDSDIKFHLAILNATHNPYIIRICTVVLELFSVSINKAVRTIPEISLRDHKLLFEAMKSRDEDALYEAVISSFAGWQRMM